MGGVPGSIAGSGPASRSAALPARPREAARWTELACGYSSPGLTDEAITLFLAEGLTRVAPGGGDDSEEIILHEVPLDGVLEWLRQQCAIADLKLLAGLYAASERLSSRDEP